MQMWRCSNKECKWNKTSSLVNQLSGTMHLELIKLQSEHGANTSYRKAADALTRTIGKRRINNHSRICKVTNTVGNILAESQLKAEAQVLATNEVSFKNSPKDADDTISAVSCPEPDKSNLNFSEDEQRISAETLCAVVDGGHVHDANNPGKNFEVMMAKVFDPKNIVRIDKHHTSITKKHCAGSGKYDKQAVMKVNIAKAAKEEGIDKKKTTLTGLADGAKNCWHVIKSLEPLCLLLICILDWFHIGKYIQRVKIKLPKLASKLDKISSLLWHGHVEESLVKIRALLNTVTDKCHLRILNNFHEYIFENKKYIVDYDDRSNKGLAYTSHIAESTVEHLLNDRCKRKQKMQWSRDGIHAVIQIRVSQSSNNWDNDWENIIKARYQATA